MAWHTPLFRTFFPGMIWHYPRQEKAVYLTFDDGPDPEVTPRVLDLLNAHGAKATFFCVGSRVEAYPEVYQRIIAEGHSTGNHTWSHPNGWKTSTTGYIEDVQRAARVIGSDLFRPPYGKVTPGQWMNLRTKVRLVMWDVLPGDWKSDLTGKQVADHVLRSVKPGSIVVLHDSAKAASRMLPALELVMRKLNSVDFGFKAIV